LEGGSARRQTTIYTGQQNTEKRGHTSMPPEGFEPMLPVFQRLKTVRALHRTAIGSGYKPLKIFSNSFL